jgi:hypothetical protein
MRLDVSGGGCGALAAETSRGMHTAAVGAGACVAGLRWGEGNVRRHTRGYV